MAYVTRESRYAFADTYTDPDGFLVTDEHVPFRYDDREDNKTHVVIEGQSWRDIAQRFYGHLSERAAGLYWVLLHYQPEPVVDSTIPPRPNTTVYGPGDLTLINEVLGQKRVEFL